MFFVTLLLNELARAGCARSRARRSLRALLYMDEIFGFFPPVANPPSKTPMLTLLKQARAFGLGVVLATQNPVDLDYKGLANAGTWFLGRLQTERDKARVLDGLEGASPRGRRLRPRAARRDCSPASASARFLMHNVHEDAPVLFETRWALSYLAGPLTREQIRRLKGSGGSAAGRRPPRPGERVASRRGARCRRRGGPCAAAADSAGGDPGAVRAAPTAHGAGLLQPRSLGQGRVHFQSADAGWISRARSRARCRSRPAKRSWSIGPTPQRSSPAGSPTSRRQRPPASPVLPAEATRAKSFESWAKSFKDFLARSEELTVYSSKELGLSSKPGESEGEFRVRLAVVARERRDGEVDKVKARLAPKFTALDERMRRAQAKVAEQKSQATAQTISTAASVFGAVAGALFGRRKLSTATLSRAATSARSASRSMKESRDVGLAEEGVEAVQARLAELDAELAAAVAEVEQRTDPRTIALTARALKPKKTDVELVRVGLVWLPQPAA